MHPDRWLILIYTIPTTPTGNRAAVWRELKRLGAVYLRDGVAVVPDRAEHRSAFAAIEQKIEADGGWATVIAGVELPPKRVADVVKEAFVARQSEYAEIVLAAKAFLEHVVREQEHRDLTTAELTSLQTDLTKLERWLAQVRVRDFAGAEDSEISPMIDRCTRVLAVRIDRQTSRAKVT